MSRAGVNKGKAFERETARALRVVNPRARRCLQYQRMHGAPDVDAEPLWVECKARAVAVPTVYRATAKAAKAGSIPAVVSRAGRGPALFTIALKDLPRLLRAGRKGGRP